MRIAINALSVRGGGGLTYLQQLLRQLSIQGSRHEFVILVTPERVRDLVPAAPNVFTLEVSIRGIARRLWWEQLQLPGLLQREGIDILLAPGNIGPVLLPTRFVVVVQNVYPLMHRPVGEPLPFKVSLQVSRRLIIRSVHCARRVVAVSEYTRRLIVKECDVDPATVTVIPHGRPEDNHRHDDEVQERLGLRRPYLLAVSDIRHNKNYPRLIEAFKSAALAEFDLVIAGASEHRKAANEMLSTIRRCGVEDRVRILGVLSSPVLRSVYEGAVAVVLPSLFESFGLPALEAMTYGVPVVASRIDAVVEVCGDAVSYFDPYEIPSMAEAIRRVAMDAEIRQQLISSGLARAGRYSWAETARRVLAVLEDAGLN